MAQEDPADAAAAEEGHAAEVQASPRSSTVQAAPVGAPEPAPGHGKRCAPVVRESSWPYSVAQACHELYSEVACWVVLSLGAAAPPGGVSAKGDEEAPPADRSEGAAAEGRRLAGDALLDSVSLAVTQQVAMMIPGTMAAHYGLLAAASPVGVAGAVVAPACVPLPVFFSLPPVPADAWLANKRATAFYRACIVCVYAQGTSAFFRLLHGDLVGGLLDSAQCLLGAWATDVAQGLNLMPSYVVVCGCTSVLGVLHCVQSLPLPAPALPALLPPLLAGAAAYCGWQLCKEVWAVGAGLAGAGAQDTWFVREMGGEWWPAAWVPGSPGPASSAAAAEGDFAEELPWGLARCCAFAPSPIRLGPR